MCPSPDLIDFYTPDSRDSSPQNLLRRRYWRGCSSDDAHWWEFVVARALHGAGSRWLGSKYANLINMPPGPEFLQWVPLRCRFSFFVHASNRFCQCVKTLRNLVSSSPQFFLLRAKTIHRIKNSKLKVFGKFPVFRLPWSIVAKNERTQKEDKNNNNTISGLSKTRKQFLKVRL